MGAFDTSQLGRGVGKMAVRDQDTAATESSVGNGETRTLARFAAKLRYDDIPTHVVDMAKKHTLNILACSLRGHSLESAQIVIRGHKRMGGVEEATVVGEGLKLPAPAAAGINAHTAYCTMNDDTFYEGVCHPGHTAISAALAVGEAHGASGKDYLTAVITGLEVGCRVAASLCQSQESHKSRMGWHCNIADGFVGIGSAGKILGLDEEQFVAGIGIAATSSSGLLETEYPTYVWPWDGGKATYLSVLGAYFAKDGMTAGDTAPGANARLVRGLGHEWHTTEIGIKIRCASYMVHSAIEAAQRVVLRNRVKLEDIETITLKQSFWTGLRLMRHDIVDFNTTVFSTPYAIAVALVDGQPMTLPDQMVAHLKDPRVRALMETIRTELDPSIDAIFGAQMPAVAILRTRSGRTFEERVEKTKGKYPELPFTEEEFLYKIQTNAGHTLRREKIDELVAFVKEIEHSKNIGELAALVRG
jgi:2-methylcitrate dehydratase PrpD